MGVLGERKNELHVINSKEGADKTESKDDDDGTYISIRIHILTYYFTHSLKLLYTLT